LLTAFPKSLAGFKKPLHAKEEKKGREGEGRGERREGWTEGKGTKGMVY